MIKEIIKKIPLVVPVYEGCAKRIGLIKESDHVKRYMSIGNGIKNRDKKFFRINSMLTGGSTGLYSATLVIVLPYMEFAIKKGWIPVIDFSAPISMPLLQDDKFGIENPWEYYYKQPKPDISLEEVYQSKYVYDGWYWRKKVGQYNWLTMFPTDKKTLKYWHDMIATYIRLTDDLEKRVEVEKEKIFRPGQKILGVGIRAGLRAGEMRKEKLYNGHPKQPTCEEMMEIVEGKMKEWNIDCIFLAIDDREYFNKFIARFGDKCSYLNRRLMHFFSNDKPLINRKDIFAEYDGTSVREKTEEYIIETYLLAQCDSLYSCHGGGATFAYFLNGGKYEHVDVYDAGIYEKL